MNIPNSCCILSTFPFSTESILWYLNKNCEIFSYQIVELGFNKKKWRIEQSQ